jgi:hypothetical protein
MPHWLTSPVERLVMHFVGDDLVAENEHLRSLLAEKLVGEVLIEDINIRDNGLNIQMKGGAAQLLAECFARQFIESGATNYLEVSFSSTGLMPDESLVVTLQKVSGKTPHAFRVEAEAKLQELESKLTA